MFIVNYGTSAGNYESNMDLNDLMHEVSEGLSYTQRNVTIENENGEIVARLPWYGLPYFPEDEYEDEEYEVTADFGQFGYYGKWYILDFPENRYI
jgi:hypothetical protein